ncbi:MAG TPA: D-alanyl-D-alanine carboxypeptidase family protein [Opitutaceae bacterium]
MTFPRLVTLGLLLLPLFASAADKKVRPTRPTADGASAYKGAIIVDAATGNVLFEDRADIVSPPASMTKLMSFAVVYDALQKGTLRLDTPVRISKDDMGMAGTQVWLDPRETIPVEDLIYAMMVQSANDAAHALARAAAGSRGAFLELMNAKARELGMEKTTFRTPHGLPPSNRKLADGDLTSPRDFAILSRYLIQKTTVLKYTVVEKREFTSALRKKPVMMDNHNNLLGKVAGVDGLKTGFTNGAGFCIAATAARDGRLVIVVTMGSDTSKTRDLAVTELIERGFAALPALPPPPPLVSGGATGAAASAPASQPAAAAPKPEPQDDTPKIHFSIPKR